MAAGFVAAGFVAAGTATGGDGGARRSGAASRDMGTGHLGPAGSVAVMGQEQLLERGLPAEELVDTGGYEHLEERLD